MIRYGGMGCGNFLGGNLYDRKGVGNCEEYDGMCEKCCDVGRGNIELLDIFQGVEQGCTLTSILVKVYISGMIIAGEAAKQRVTVGEDTVSD